MGLGWRGKDCCLCGGEGVGRGGGQRERDSGAFPRRGAREGEVGLPLQFPLRVVFIPGVDF